MQLNADSPVAEGASGVWVSVPLALPCAIQVRVMRLNAHSFVAGGYTGGAETFTSRRAVITQRQTAHPGLFVTRCRGPRGAGGDPKDFIP